MTVDRLVIVPMKSLDDLCVLAERAAERVNVTTRGPEDALVMALRSVVREIRVHSLLEPIG